MRKVLLMTTSLLIVFLSSCWPLLDDVLIPDEDKGLVRIRIQNPRFQQASHETSSIPIDTETIGLRIVGVPPIVQVKSFEGNEHVEFAFLLLAPMTYDFYLIGACNSEILTCYAVKEGVEILPDSNTVVIIEMQTYEASSHFEVATTIGTYVEPEYSSSEPREVYWAVIRSSLSFVGQDLGDFFHSFFSPTPQQYLQTEYNLDKWHHQSFWRDREGNWSKTPVDGRDHLFRESSNSIVVGRSNRTTFSILVPLMYADTGNPYEFSDGIARLAIPIKWSAFDNMKAGLILETPIDLSSYIAETVIIVR